MSATANPTPLREIDELDRAIVNLSARINSETHELLALVREFDERAGWLKWGFHDCASWLHWRCDLSVGAAREKLRVAHALKSLRTISAAFQAGKLSYSKVRALVRVANRDNEDALVDFALKTTAAIVEERCRDLRCGTEDSLEEANRACLARSLTIRRDLRRGMMTLTVELPMEAGELIDKALDRARDESTSVEFGDEPWAARQAVTRALSTPIMSDTGRPVAKPGSTTSCCCAPAITASCTRAAIASTRTSGIAGCSGGRTA